MQSTPFESHKSARFADSALKISLGAMEQAQQCAGLWFGEIMRRELFRKLRYSSINQYAPVELLPASHDIKILLAPPPVRLTIEVTS